MCIIYILFHNYKYSRIKNLSRRKTRNVIKGWWAFRFQLCVQGYAWVKGKPNWKKKYSAKSNFIISSVFRVILWSIYSIASCYCFGWHFFFFGVFITSIKSSILLTTVVGWFFYFPLSWHWHLPHHSTAIMAYIYCQTQHFWKNITKGFYIHLWFHYMTAILVMQICIWYL